MDETLTKYADMIEQLVDAYEAQAAMPDTHMETVVLPEARRLVAQARHAERQQFWRAPSGRVHSLRGCTGGPGPARMQKAELTRTEFDALVVGGFASRHEDERCRCASWREART